MSFGRIEQLTIYPVKSLAGINLTQARVTSFGLDGDRRWMPVNDKGRFVTQRVLPALARIQPQIRAGQLYLTAKGMPDILLPDPALDAPSLEVIIWKDACLAQAASPDVNQWLTKAAGSDKPLRLVTMTPGFTRPAKEERFGPNSHTYFADASPFLIANEASLTALNQHLQTDGNPAVDIRHFRANIVISGLPAFAEHHVRELHIQSIQFGLKDHCQRCSVITVNPDSGEFSPNAVPFNEVTQLNPMPDNPKAPAFGVNAVLLAGGGMPLNLGDSIQITP